ncbi:carbon storage regulator [Microcella daejeonensis]|uniref:Translational regulator CsrA n=1 Tax=Microcella daejeonensis TaxID=2994971 RepID=A0A9E8MLG6_9MICO|nr:carbon storage regulator [Microcella daejeonensis]WAB81717.1 carbon storage regulator [Microcella daejeonensis]
MLVLTRKPGDRILVGDDIIITVLDSRGDGVRIGIEAPAGVRIHREEVVRAVEAANAQAAAAAAGTDAAALGLPPAATPSSDRATGPAPASTPGD